MKDAVEVTINVKSGVPIPVPQEVDESLKSGCPAGVDPTCTKRSSLAKEEFVAKAPVATTTTAPVSAVKATDGSTHSLESLKSGCPAGVDPTCKETYLDDATFKSIFNTDKAAFAALPKWKRDEQKKKAGLF